MEYLLHLKPTYNCLANFGDFQQELSKNKIHTFIVNNTENVNIAFYPLDNHEGSASLPFAYTFNQNKITQKNEIKAIKFPEQNYLLIVKPFLLTENKILNIKSKVVSFGGTSHTLLYGKNSKLAIKIECSQTQSPFEINYDKEILNLNTKSIDNNLLIYCQTIDDTFVVCLIEFVKDNYHLKKLEEVDILEEQKDKITTYKKENDFANHGTVCEYIFENKSFCQKTSLVYDNCSPLIAKQKEIIPLAFFDAIKLKNIKLARKYLSETLNKKLSDKHLKNFFGNFLETTQTLSKDYSPNEIALVFSNEKSEFFAKIFCLSFDEKNLIKNISES